MHDSSPRQQADDARSGGTAAETDQSLIAARAHCIWESEGRPEGRADEHWFRASEEFRQLEREHARRTESAAPPSPEADKTHGHETGDHASVHSGETPARANLPDRSAAAPRRATKTI